ncbi:peptidase S41 [[Bacillus] enclensis]|jgi:carboxyl-terminal processing protease|uniref:Carboxyl-terminal processing protease n=1 Tax=[Bacillus] enclensis TaxID=1402860 RepID=A0A0V8HBL7_9BACI|nr:S41 family peptidase [[Bacillus] enclensis]KSU59862.1 peptidase S41 [[Bacillus] enclensis]SCC28122.1 carboxyl-terminal processing protease [[Bacillus] enclensis]
MELKGRKLIITILISMLIGAGGMYGGFTLFDFGNSGDELTEYSGNGDVADKLHKVEVAYDLISEKFFQDVNKGELVEGAIQGMLKTLNDPYSVYMNAETASQFNDALDSSFEGIGAEVTMMDGKLVIVAPFKNSPAEEAGLKPNDRIVKIDGSSIDGLDLYEATLKIRGKKGTEVKLELLREGVSEPIEVSVKRDEIPVETVHSDVKKVNGTKTGYIQITTFSENTAADFKKQLAELEKDKVKGLVIDVRGNPGGLLSSVEQILQEFVTGKKPYIQIQERNGEVMKSFSDKKEKKAYPVVVLIDEGSASASEILAGALKETEGYPLIGTKSFGKGTVQQAVPMGDGSNIKLTMYKWLTPNGNWIHKKGIRPDVAVKQPAYYYAHPLQIEKPLKPEMNNEQVKNAQEMLKGLGFMLDRSDGYYSKKTEQAVKEFQIQQGLDSNGIIDSKTAEHLQAEIYQQIQNEKNDLQLQAAIEYVNRIAKAQAARGSE